MPITLRDDAIRVTIAPEGAQLTSLYDLRRDRELLWQADPAIWGRHAPILFPIVGRLAGDEARHGQLNACMGQHGFARDRLWQVLQSSPQQVILGLNSDADTRAVYPYDFSLELRYRLEGALLELHYRVVNRSAQVMPFSIGAHPGFRCPFVESEAFDDYYVEFEREETLERIELDASGLRTGSTKPCLKAQRELPLSRATFDEDALIFSGLDSTHVSLRSRKSAGGVRMHFAGFPYFAIWSKPRVDAPFVCFEPWFGIADALGPHVAFADKLGIIQLPPGETFECSHSIEPL